VQVRQITRALRATTYHTVASNTIALLSPLYAVPECAEFLSRVQSNPDAATPAKTVRFHLLMPAAFRHWDNLYYQFRNDMLEPGMWKSYDHTMSGWIATPAWRDWFVANAVSFSDSLQALVRQRISESGL